MMDGEEQDGQGNVPYSYPQPMESPIEGSLKYQLDPDQVIERIRHILLGHKKVYNTTTGVDEWVPDEKRRKLINEEGMNILEPILRGYLDKIFPLSDLEQQQIEYMTLGLEYDIRNLFTLNFLRGNKWEIPNLTTSSVIKNLICNQVYATLRKAYLSGYQKFLKTIQRVHEVQAFKGNINQYDQPTGGGEVGRKKGIGRLPIVGGFFR